MNTISSSGVSIALFVFHVEQTLSQRADVLRVKAKQVWVLFHYRLLLLLQNMPGTPLYCYDWSSLPFCRWLKQEGEVGGHCCRKRSLLWLYITYVCYSLVPAMMPLQPLHENAADVYDFVHLMLQVSLKVLYPFLQSRQLIRCDLLSSV